MALRIVGNQSMERTRPAPPVSRNAIHPVGTPSPCRRPIMG